MSNDFLDDRESGTYGHLRNRVDQFHPRVRPLSNVSKASMYIKVSGGLCLVNVPVTPTAVDQSAHGRTALQFHTGREIMG